MISIARHLLDTGQLWPECLSDEELREEWSRTLSVADKQPISCRMLLAELQRRGLLTTERARMQG